MQKYSRYPLRHGLQRMGLSCENRFSRSILGTLERRRYNSSFQNQYKWERNTKVAGEVLCSDTKQGNSGTQLQAYMYIIFLCRKPRGTLKQEFFSASCVDFWNSLYDSTVSRDIISLKVAVQRDIQRGRITHTGHYATPYPIVNRLWPPKGLRNRLVAHGRKRLCTTQ